MAYDYDIQAWYETVNQSAIMAYDLGSYIPDSAYVTYSTAGTNTDQIPKLINRDPANSEDVALIVPNTESEESITLVSDVPLKRSQYIGRDQINRVGMQYAAQLGQKLGSNVAEGMSNRIASLMAITALTGSNTVTFDDESTDYNDWVKAGEDAGALLDDDKVPHAGRYALVKPEFFRKVAQANYYGSSDFRQGADNTNLANTFTAAGVTWIAWPSPVFSQNLSSNTDYPSKYRRDFSADRLQGIVFSDSAFAVKMAEALSVEENYIPERRAHLITAAVQFGTAVLHSEGFAAIIGDVGS